jgi:hypothetical protein
MAVATLPDVIGALIARYRSFSAITALTSTRISAAVQQSWNPMPRHAILVSGPVGAPGRTLSEHLAGIQNTRVDLYFYGSTSFEAMRLWRVAAPYICPRQDTLTQFVQSGCRFTNVFQEGGPSRADEDDTGWPRVLATYVYKWSEFPVA